MAYTLDRDLYLTADREIVVEEDDPRAAFFLGNKGSELTDEEAARLGLTSKKAAAKTEDKKAAEPANKSRTKKAAKKA